MASVGQCSLGACLGLIKNINSLPIVQSGNARCFSRLSTNQQKSNSTFSQSLLWGKKNLNVSKRSKEDQWTTWCSDDGSCGIAPGGSPSVKELVHEFYDAINLKNAEGIKKLNKLISQNCELLDLFFYIPFGGKQTIVTFLGNLMEAMGPNFRVVLTDVQENEGEDLTAKAIWHLEWKHNNNNYEIPFTAGYSVLNFELVEGRLTIRKITGMKELPIKLSDLVLKLLKAISTVFDSFPIAAEGLLQKSHTSHGGLLMLLDMLGAYRKH